MRRQGKEIVEEESEPQPQCFMDMTTWVKNMVALVYAYDAHVRDHMEKMYVDQDDLARTVQLFNERINSLELEKKSCRTITIKLI